MEADCSVHPENFEYFSKYLNNYHMIQGSRLFNQKKNKSFINKGLIRTFISNSYSFVFKTLLNQHF